MFSRCETLLCPNEQWCDLICELLATHKTLRLRLRGMSMYPAIHHDDIAYVQSVKPETIHLGAVVLYTINGSPIVHRIVCRRKRNGVSRFLICSDYSGRGHWILPENIYGKVLAIERNDHILSFEGWRGQLWGWVFSRVCRKLRATLRFLKYL